ncbi:histone-lysine N-trimethyltransferase SMYD5 [Euwallacea similis]|uniref:histone-lysine N-trimethyltransferase SMYD5 n=1 Tax=Euwallacea similis TaxID=1736056 RepID=UPI00345017F9
MNVEIRNLPSSKGKCLYATSNIPEGTIIFEEEPLVSCQFSWNACCKYKACDHCLRPLETAEENVRRLTGNSVLELPYLECCQTKQLEITSCPACGTQYCSEWCRVTALEQYHKVICLQTLNRSKVLPLEQLEETWKQMHYPPETSSIFLIVRLLARILQAPNSEEAIQTTLGFCHRTINEETELAHKFLGDKFIGQVGLLREMVINALPNQRISQFLTPEGFQSLIALIGTNGQGIGSSPFSAWRQNVEQLDLPSPEKEEINSFIDKIYDDIENHTGDFLNSEGVGLYLKQSCANHSCDPNAEIQFLHNNFKLSLVALRDVKPDEEICISYLGDCELNRSRHSRQKLLKENYIFECDCPKCITDIEEPDVTSEEEMSAENED